MADEELELEEQQQELYEHHRITVDRGQEMLRIDRYLQMRLEGVSRNKVQAAVKAGCVRVNDKEVKSNYRVKPMDVVTVLLPEPPHEFELLPEKVDFTTVYEDDDVLVVDKPAGMVVHPGVGNWTGTLMNGLLYYYGIDPAKEPAKKAPYPYLVHRIDKDTSGLLVCALTADAYRLLQRQFLERTVAKRYVALLEGVIAPAQGKRRVA